MASSSSSSVQQKYQVFLSFRGEDTRNNFTSHLHEGLKRNGIDTYVDYRLEKGEEICEALSKAIEESKISIIVLSKNYASSSWCLDELSKILDCKERMGHKVIPIFYHVDPSDVRKQTGSFEEAFAKHQERFKDRKDKVEKWRAAFVEVAGLAGHHLHGQPNDRPDSTLISEIVKEISEKLMYKSLYDTKHLVGIDSHIEKIESLLCIDSKDVRIIGISGMGGIGKTTIAEAMYVQFFAKFEGYCFLNVKEKLNCGRVHLREELFSKILEDKNLNLDTSLLSPFINERLHCKKIFIVLDDVNDSTELLDLLPQKYYFGPGSRIIVISRDKQVLRQVVDEMYEVEGMVDDEALQLFSMHAFKQRHPKEDFIELSKKMIHYAKGVPLALRVVGSSLYGGKKCDWEGHLNKLENISDPKIDNVLKISYNGLDDEVKDIFLDIACFFRGTNWYHVKNILDGCYISFSSGISILIDKSLLTISNNKLEIHDLLQLMAWNIIRQESKEPGKRSRLWTPKDICHVLKNNTGTESVEGMILDMSKIGKVCLSPTVFEKMCNLKLLKLYFTDFKRERKLYLSQQGLEYLPDKLIYLHWDDYPSKSVPLNFCPENLVELSMCNSHVEQLWNGVQDIVKLKRLYLNDSQHLIKIPDLSRATNLENMQLNGCRSLVEIPSSIQYLSKLSYLTLRGCQNLKNFPSIVDLRSLTSLILTDCSNITKFPEISVNLKILNLSGTAIEQVPLSIKRVYGLEYLYLESCTKLRSLLRTIFKLSKNLHIFRVSGFSKVEVIQELLGTVEVLNIFPSRGTAELNWSDFAKVSLSLDEFPDNVEAVENLKSLKYLRLGNCNLFSFPSRLTCISSLTNLDLSRNNFETIPASIKQLLGLERLDLSYCKRLQSLPELPPNVKYLNAHSCSSLEAVSSLFTLGCGWPITYLFSNCLKLDQNAVSHILAETQLWIQHRATEDLKIDHEGIVDHSLPVTICIPGSEIPEWFSCQNKGSSVTAQLPHLDDFLCFALCAVVALEDYDESISFMVKCKYKFNSNYRNHYADLGVCDISAGSDYMFLGHTKTHKCFSEASFEFYVFQSPCKVKKCGVHLLYPQNDQVIYEDYGCDLPYAKNTEKSNSIMIYQPSSSSDPTWLSLRCGVNNQDFGEQMVEDGTIIKGCRSDYCYDEAEPSRSFDPGRDALMIQPSSPYDPTWLSLNCGVIDQGLGEPMQEDGTIIKRCHDDHHNNQAEPSGNLSSQQEEEEDEPRPKKLKRIIMTNRTLLFKSKVVVRRRKKSPWINPPTRFSARNKSSRTKQVKSHNKGAKSLA